MATSNTYTFGSNTQLDDLMRESFERIGIIGNEFTGLQTQSFVMSANLELTEWQGKTPLSWLRKQFMFEIYPGQPIYNVPFNISNVVDVISTQPTRLNTGGTAFSSSTVGGSAANCFNPNSTVGCTQGVANGYISYNYGAQVSPSIQYVGITPLFSEYYTLDIQYSFDNVNWFTAYQTPETHYVSNQIIWWVVENSLNARVWRIRETGGNTLAIQQIYFDQPTQIGSGDRTLTSFSYTEWMQLPQKMVQGIPSAYFFNNQIQPLLTLWPVPGPTQLNQTYTNILCTGYRYSQDVTNLFNEVDLPQRWYEAFVSGISARLARKFAMDQYQVCKMEATETWNLAASQDGETVTIRFQPDFTSYMS